MSNKEKLIAAIESGLVPDKVCEIFITLASEYVCKGDLMKIAYSEKELAKVDSAVPQPYADAIRQLMPSWRWSYAVYDYNRLSLGGMENVAELTLNKIADLMYRHERNLMTETSD